jgi:hypothetical protein
MPSSSLTGSLKRPPDPVYDNPVPDKPESKEKKEKKEKFIDPVALGLSALTAVSSALIGSLFGVSGTLLGIAIGPVAYGCIYPVYELCVHKAHSRLLKLPKKAMIGVIAGTVVFGGIGALAFTAVSEAATGKTLYGTVTGSRSYGSSFGTTATTPPSPAPSYIPSASYSPSPSATVTVSPSSSPSPSPSSSPAPSVTPEATYTPSPSGSGQLAPSPSGS